MNNRQRAQQDFLRRQQALRQRQQAQAAQARRQSSGAPTPRPKPTPTVGSNQNDNTATTVDQPQPQSERKSKKRGRPSKNDAVEPVGEETLEDEQIRKIRRWIELDNRISQLNAEKKLLVEEKRELDDEMVAVLQPTKAPVRSGDTLLSLKTQKTRRFNKKNIAKGLIESGELKDPEKAAAVVDFIYKSRDVVENVKVVRNDPK